MVRFYLTVLGGIELLLVIPEVERKYLREIYELEINGVFVVGPKEIGDRLNVTRATAHEYLTKLANKGLLYHLPRKGFYLSDKGRCMVKRLIRNHRILETLLVRFIGLDLEEACELASKMENSISSTIIEKIYRNIGSPNCCPHGKPIPSLKEC